MSGEDELRQLDEEFAAGRLSAEDYRQRRDGLLSQSGGQQSQQDQRPDPFPPAFRWETTESSETTQYIAPIPGAAPESTPGPDPKSEQTQIIDTRVPGPPGDSDTTQVVTAQPPGSGPADRAPAGSNPVDRNAVSPPPQGWTSYQAFPPAGRQDQVPRAPAPNDGTAPPWAGLDVADPSVPGWGPSSYQEPDAFEADPAPGRGRIFAIIGAVVLIAALVTGTVLFLTRDSATTAAPPAPPPAAPTTSAPPEPFGPLVVPNGIARLQTYTPTEFDTQRELADADKILIKQFGIAGARAVIVDDQVTVTSLWAFTPSRNPDDLRERLDTDQLRFRYVRVPEAGPGGLRIYTSDQENAGRRVTVFRADYVSGNDVIRVDVFGADASSARERFDAVLADQLDHNPPTS